MQCPFSVLAGTRNQELSTSEANKPASGAQRARALYQVDDLNRFPPFSSDKIKIAGTEFLLFSVPAIGTSVFFCGI
jgi:hypothetical protein